MARRQSSHSSEWNFDEQQRVRDHRLTMLAYRTTPFLGPPRTPEEVRDDEIFNHRLYMTMRISPFSNLADFHNPASGFLNFNSPNQEPMEWEATSWERAILDRGDINDFVPREPEDGIPGQENFNNYVLPSQRDHYRRLQRYYELLEHGDVTTVDSDSDSDSDSDRDIDSEDDDRYPLLPYAPDINPPAAQVNLSVSLADSFLDNIPNAA